MHNLSMMCINRQFGTQIGETIGKMMDVDVEEDDTGWKNFPRIKIEIDLKKSLACGRSITLGG